MLVSVISFATASSAETITGAARVIDGDTLQIGRERVRLRRINAPELDTVAGKASAAVMVELVHGREVVCVTVARDAYARLVADCAVEGRDLGELMVARGAARRR